MRKIILMVAAVFSLLSAVSVFAVPAKNGVKDSASTEIKTEVIPETKSETQLGTKTAAKIGVLDLNKVLLDSPQLAEAKTKFKKKFEAREKELDEAQKKFRGAIETFSKNSPTMKSDVQKEEQQKIIEQQKKLQEMQAKFQEEATIAQSNLMKDIVKKVEDVVDKVAGEKNLDLVIAKASLAYSKKELEITDEVSKRLKKQ
ncbi:MAG: OmpH family outer membrane protein [Coxiellaceae bacterium]|nr:OmpH family outer membrane protein [Coxiellaceae bacterium]